MRNQLLKTARPASAASSRRVLSNEIRSGLPTLARTAAPWHPGRPPPALEHTVWPRLSAITLSKEAHSA